jgi:hypothetical protein
LQALFLGAPRAALTMFLLLKKVAQFRHLASDLVVLALLPTLVHGFQQETARAAAKRAVLGYLYGLGPAKYRKNAYKDTGEDISEEVAERDRQAFRTAYPEFHRWQKDYGSYKDETNLPKPDMWETRSARGWRRVVSGQYERKSEWKQKNNIPADWIPKYTDRLNGPHPVYCR